MLPLARLRCLRQKLGNHRITKMTPKPRMDLSKTCWQDAHVSRKILRPSALHMEYVSYVKPEASNASKDMFKIKKNIRSPMVVLFLLMPATCFAFACCTCCTSTNMLRNHGRTWKMVGNVCSSCAQDSSSEAKTGSQACKDERVRRRREKLYFKKYLTDISNDQCSNAYIEYW